MRSQKYSRDLALIRSDLRRCWPLAAAIFVIEAIALPLTFYIEMLGKANYFDSSDWYGDSIVLIRLLICCVFVFMLAPASALAVFNHYYRSDSAAATAALPVKRSELFFTKLISSYLLLAMPGAASFLLSLPSLISIGLAKATVNLAVTTLLIPLLFLSIALLCMTLTGHAFASVVAYAVVNGWYVVTAMMISGFSNTYVYGEPGDAMTGDLFAVLSPIYYMFIHSDDSAGTLGSPSDALIYTVIIIVCIVAAFYFDKKRKLERTEEMAAFGFIGMAGRLICAFFGGATSAFLLTTIFGAQKLAFFIPIFVTFAFIFITAAQMIIKKSPRVFKGRLFIEWAALCAVVICATAAISVAARDRVPDISSVETVCVNADYAIYARDEAETDAIIALHQKAVDNRKSITSNINGNTRHMQIRYTLKNGSEITRSYNIPTSDETGIYADLLAMQNDPERFLYAIFHCDPDDIKPLSSSVHIWSENFDRQRDFNAEETGKLIGHFRDAIMDGKYTPTQLVTLNERGGNDLTEITITFELKDGKRIPDISNGYYDYNNMFNLEEFFTDSEDPGKPTYQLSLTLWDQPAREYGSLGNYLNGNT